ncbi:MFS transporter [Prauserella alba]|uniref:MFS transporter n=1 Tax=Prauserella alba TaxID=176898 RepID=A0ABN1V8B3_9PSEU|nr:MFS transporter [Prauserella alba]MCP2181513.1 MFS transporter, MHS family, proline/betaine transporter [Prauserella alba]
MTINDVPDARMIRKVIRAASIGNFVEWFDFALYGFLATEIATNFFPSGDSTAGLLKTFAAFAVAFALRPIGGAYFGALGDRIGRKRTLAITVLLMAGSTVALGLLPAYSAIGIAAPILLVLIRCVQGFSTGGEYAGACAFVLEHCNRGRRAWYSSFLPVSTFAAFGTAATVSFAFSSWLGADVMTEWGWRVPFLVAAPLGICGFYIRQKLDETPDFQQVADNDTVASAPLREAVRSHGPTMAKLGLFICTTALSFYMFTTYMTTYLEVTAGHSASMTLLSNVLALMFAAALCPFVGRFSDRFGRRATMFTASGLLVVGVLPAFLLAGNTGLTSAVLGQLVLALGAVSCNVVTAVLLVELFPTRVRYTASALTYNLAYALFGGTAPFIATFLIEITGDPLAPAYYLAVAALFALFAAWALPETSRSSLSATESTSHERGRSIA